MSSTWKRKLRNLGLITLALLLGILLVRTAQYRSRQVAVEPAPELSLDPQQYAVHLAGALRFRTVSHPEPERFEGQEFLGLHRYLEQTFPRAHSSLKRETVGPYSLLYTWPGSDPKLKPLLLMGHMDVVPVEPGTEGQWTAPPFEGRIQDGFIWGRGAWDDKCSVLSILEAVEILLSEGFQPRRTLLLAFGHDEEVGGAHGSAQIAALLAERNIQLEAALDEGLVITFGMAPGVKAPVALIGLAEKGYLNVALSVQSEGGHSSAPPSQTAIGILAQAVERLERHPMPATLEGLPRQMTDALGPETPLPLRVVFANLWLFGPLLQAQLAGNPSSNALLRTTTAVTMISGGVRENVLPAQARAIVNFRLRPGDSINSVLAHVRSTVDDPRVDASVSGDASEASDVSSAESDDFLTVARSLRQVLPEALVAPSLGLGATDARHYQKLTRNIYRFLPVRVHPKDLGRFHGKDERVAVEDYVLGIRFYRQIIRNFDQNPTSP